MLIDRRYPGTQLSWRLVGIFVDVVSCVVWLILGNVLGRSVEALLVAFLLPMIAFPKLCDKANDSVVALST